MEAHNLVSTLLHLRRFGIKNFCSKVSLESKMLLGFEDDPYYGPHILDNILMICISTLFFSTDHMHHLLSLSIFKEQSLLVQRFLVFP